MENIDKIISKYFKDEDITKYIQEEFQKAIDNACKQYLFENNNKKEKEINVIIKKPKLQKRIENINGKIKNKSKANIPLMKKAKLKNFNKKNNRINFGLQISANKYN